MTYKRPYIESSVFVAYIKGEIKGDALDHDCKAIVDSILESAEGGDFPICTSSLTIAEVYKNKRQGKTLTEQENEDLRPYFREKYIRLIEVDREIAERANELCRNHDRSSGLPALRPNDAIHIACAERAGCEVLLAYDNDLTRQQHPDMRIEWPQRTNLVELATQLALETGAVQEPLALGSPEEENSEIGQEEETEGAETPSADMAPTDGASSANTASDDELIPHSDAAPKDEVVAVAKPMDAAPPGEPLLSPGEGI